MLATDKLTKPVIRYQTDHVRLEAFGAQVVVKMDSDDTWSSSVHVYLDLYASYAVTVVY